jgi:hypothetical protein
LIAQSGGVVGKDKSVFEKITGKVKDIATIAADTAQEALKAEQPPLKADQRSAVYIPLAADGLVSDPMMVPPVAVVPARKRKPAAPKRSAKASKRSARKAAKKSARTTAKKSAAKRSKQAAKNGAKKTNRKTARRVAKKARKRTGA